MERTLFNHNMGNVSLTDSLSTTAEIDFRGWNSGTVFIPSGETAVTFTFHVAPEPGGTYEAAYTEQNTAVVITSAADRAFPIPLTLNGVLTAIQGAGSIKIVANVAATVQVCLKG